MNRQRLAALSITASLAVASCGGSGGADDSSGPAPTDSTEAASTTDADDATAAGEGELGGAVSDDETTPPETEPAADLPIDLPAIPPTATSAVGLDPLAWTNWTPLEPTAPPIPTSMEASIQAYFSDLISLFQTDPRRVAVASSALLSAGDDPVPNVDGLLTIFGESLTFGVDTWTLTAAHADAGVSSGDPQIAAFWAPRLTDATNQRALGSVLVPGFAGVAGAEPADVQCFLVAVIRQGCDSRFAAELDAQLAALPLIDGEQIDDAWRDSDLGSELFCQQWVNATATTDTGVDGFVDLWIAWDDTSIDAAYLGASECGWSATRENDPPIGPGDDADVLTSYFTAIADTLLAGGYTDDEFDDLGGGTDAERDLYDAYQFTLLAQVADVSIETAGTLRSRALTPEIHTLLTSVASLSAHRLDLFRLGSDFGGGVRWDDVEDEVCPIFAAVADGYGDDERQIITDGLGFIRLSEDFAPACSLGGGEASS